MISMIVQVQERNVIGPLVETTLTDLIYELPEVDVVLMTSTVSLVLNLNNEVDFEVG